MGAMGPHQGEITGQEGALVRSVAYRHQTVELMDFHGDKAKPQQEGDDESEENPLPPVSMYGQHNHTIRHSAAQQEHGFSQSVRKVKQFPARRTASMVGAQDDVRREERRKEDEVAHQIDPKPKGLNSHDIAGGSFFYWGKCRSFGGHLSGLQCRFRGRLVCEKPRLNGGQPGKACIFKPLDFGCGYDLEDVVV